MLELRSAIKTQKLSLLLILQKDASNDWDTGDFDSGRTPSSHVIKHGDLRTHNNGVMGLFFLLLLLLYNKTKVC